MKNGAGFRPVDPAMRLVESQDPEWGIKNIGVVKIHDHANNHTDDDN